MRRQITCLLIACRILFQTFPVHAFTGTEGAAFLELPVGARPAAMGSAYSMLAEDAYAPTWNPAGLAFIDVPQMAAMHTVYLESTSYEYGSFAVPFWRGSGLGFSIQYFNPGTINGLDVAAAPTGDIGGYSANYTVAFGQAIGEHFSLGLSGHMVQMKIDDVKAQALAGGAGLLFRPSPEWRAAAVVDHVGQKLKFLTEEDSMPTNYRLGVAYHPRPPWTIALEGAKQVDGLLSGHTGVEYETPFGFTFRTGYNTERTKELSAIAGLSIGVSMLIYKQDFAYTWLPIGDLGSSHLFSIVWRFGKSKPSEEADDEETPKLKRPPPEEEMGFILDNK